MVLCTSNIPVARVLRISGPKRDEVTGEWRKLHNGELHNLYSSPDIIRQLKPRRMRWAGHVAQIGEGRNEYRVLVGKPEGKLRHERPRRRWEDGIRIDLRKKGWGGEWIHVVQDRDRCRAVAPRNYLFILGTVLRSYIYIALRTLNFVLFKMKSGGTYSYLRIL
jgi:hypothetical protein